MTEASPRPDSPDISELAARVPPIGDKALIELVNGIQIGRENVAYRQRRGFWARVFDGIVDGDKRELLFDANLLRSQEIVFGLVQEIQDRVRVTDVALRLTQHSLLDARGAVRALQGVTGRHERSLSELELRLESVTRRLDSRIEELESRVRRLEVETAARGELDEMLSAWSAGRTYRDLPWPYAVALVAREVFSGAVGRADREQASSRWRQLFADRAVVHLERLGVPRSFSTAAMLDDAWRSCDVVDRDLIGGMLEVRSLPPPRISAMPFHFLLGASTELASLPPEVSPRSAGLGAVELCRAQVGEVPFVLDREQVVLHIVEEVAAYLADQAGRPLTPGVAR